jgi:hypothetical protein
MMKNFFPLTVVTLALMEPYLCSRSFGALQVEVCGEFQLKDERFVGLSGLTWAGGNQFYAASDRISGFIPVTLAIDPASGKISSGQFGTPVEVKPKLSDCEGIAWNAKTKTMWLSTEEGPQIGGCKLNGSAVPAIKLPAVFTSSRLNLGLESLTFNALRERAWTANEEILKADGELPTAGEGALVRLQEFDANWKPLHQFAWRTEPAAMRMKSIGNGVSDLCLLDDGQLLVLERGFGVLTLQTRLYLADFTKATATDQLRSLKETDVTPVGKSLLLQRNTGTTNYEGITQGPILADQSRSLILVADSGAGHLHFFLSLRVRDVED